MVRRSYEYKKIYRPPVNKEQDKKIKRKLDKNAILRLGQFQENTVCSVNNITDAQSCIGQSRLARLYGWLEAWETIAT